MMADIASKRMDRADPWQKLAQECTQGAAYDSNERQPHSGSKCLPGTRIELLRTIKAATEDGRRKILWISGEPGSGKSTVAHTVADSLREEGRLAGTFFFSRMNGRRSTFDFVLLTFAYQLGLQHHRAREVITKAIADDPALLAPEKSRLDQLDRLVIQPLRILASVWGRTGHGMSLVMDALDEGVPTGTGNHHFRASISSLALKGVPTGIETLWPFVSLLARLVRDTTLPISNIVITSRPSTEAVMRSMEFADIIQPIHIEDFNSREDVTLFLRNAFEEVYRTQNLSVSCPRPWPSDEDILILSDRANGRFGVAATIVRVISQDQPDFRLPLVCRMLQRSAKAAQGDMSKLYDSLTDYIDTMSEPLICRYPFINFLLIAFGMVSFAMYQSRNDSLEDVSRDL
ncbi:hypothetical protein CONPUDRAFT_170111 [Coniophora puteana RWD-64-598 SS2]|uniref:Nephrocystin 3-like N-terminal domain-containing protein n=1 Tax=Coniophora puteana (strain RWD-64-598) TaxID=741705 RepID=R7SDY3_CONPW|nr:uncharacterized protein CONPUDRAFT_170111 [Coniophora puteana RWD-64-598 SS2]EIW74381.1 hypothetical protein CONPUDRAFT_170111 [Coniophora puteana RWD-64-598 SS2]